MGSLRRVRVTRISYCTSVLSGRGELLFHGAEREGRKVHSHSVTVRGTGPVVFELLLHGAEREGRTVHSHNGTVRGTGPVMLL